MQRISENVEWGKVLALELVGVRRGDFAGRRSGQSFTIAKSIGYQNIYLPYARCRVSEAEDGATVVDMHFYAPFSVPFILFLAVATRNIIGSERILTWFVFVVIVHLVGVSLFHWETQRVLDKLRTVLN